MHFLRSLQKVDSKAALVYGGEGYLFATLPLDEFTPGGSLASGSFAKQGTLCPLPSALHAPSSEQLGASRRSSAISAPSSAHRSTGPVPASHEAATNAREGSHVPPNGEPPPSGGLWVGVMVRGVVHSTP